MEIDYMQKYNTSIDSIPTFNSESSYEVLSSSSDIPYEKFYNSFKESLDKDKADELKFNIKALFQTNNSTQSNVQKPAVSPDKTSKKIIQLVKSDEFIEGEISRTQMYLENLYLKDPELFRNSFQKAWMELYTLDEQYVYTFICIASDIDYEWLSDKADALFFGGYAHSSPLINEAVLRAVEAWGNKHFLAYLEQMKVLEDSWLEDYKNNVMEYLKRLP